MSSREVLPNNLPIEYFEELAAGQRRTMHNSVSKLRTVATQNIKDRLDVNRNLRQHFWPAAGVTAITALVIGYNLTGIITDR